MKVNLVSNRTVASLKVTTEVLDKQNIYYDQVLLAESEYSDINSRFKAIANGTPLSQFRYKQNIIAYYGDNIQDFPQNYQNNYIDQDINADMYKDFGVKYFVLPNPYYGSWTKNEFK